jgi:hypothetical protein
VDWDAFELDSLAQELRHSCQEHEGERMVAAFEHALGLARKDPEMLACLLGATVALLAWADHVSPRGVLETYFRRAVSDEKWREVYLPLFNGRG